MHAVTANPADRQAARDAGADHVIVAKENFAEEVMRITAGKLLLQP